MFLSWRGFVASGRTYVHAFLSTIRLTCASSVACSPTAVRDADALVHSNEMSSFLASTGEVAMYATKTAVHVAALPVTVPLHVVSFTTDMVVGTCARAVGSLCHAVNQAIHPTGGENTASFHPVEGLIRNVTGMVPFMLHAANKIKDDIGSSLLGMISPALIGDGEEHGAIMGSPIRRSASSCAGESSAEQATFLERLRLDYPSSESLADSKVVEVPTKSLKVSPRSPDVSKYLLRVCDLGLSLQSDGDRHERVYYIDLSKEYANEQLTMRAIDSLVENGLALISSCPEVQFGQKSGCDSLVDWKAENSTTKLLKRKSKLSEKDWTSLLAREVLVWSGKLRSKDAHKADVPVFLSRGILPLSPRELLHLFWDDSRTRDYNKFSLGRSTSMEIEQGVANNDDAPPRGTKVVQSETQVPFTGFSVVMSTLMHARQLDDPETYVIVSRSLNPGRAGSHVGSKFSGGKQERTSVGREPFALRTQQSRPFGFN